MFDYFWVEYPAKLQCALSVQFSNFPLKFRQFQFKKV